SQEIKRNKKFKVLPVPIFGYSPETRTYAGAVALFTLRMYNDTNTRTSNAKIQIYYTVNKQIIFENEWNYFFNKEKYFTKGNISYSKYPDLYFGIGAKTPDSNKFSFNSNRFVFEGNFLKNLGNKIFAGTNIRYLDYSNITSHQSILNPELVSNSTAGFGFTIIKDTRNNLLTPTSGVYFNFNSTYNISESNYLKTIIDFRYYRTWNTIFTLSNRYITIFNSGNVPFYDYAFLGGDQYVRGYYFGRFRDKNLTALQTEFRFRIIKKFGAAVFGGVANIFSNENKFDIQNSKHNFGFGIRILMDKKENTNLRLDYAMGSNGNTGFYIVFGESF
ncbi:MAG: BamA/TamA family outer membrane protein, partial [Bacteroidota bacterium]|nr:BamA/TamA family outer membrane protein [Bacteroidota bacterium]